MFFRRGKPHAASFDERLESLRRAGFTTAAESPGLVRVARGECAAVVRGQDPDPPEIVSLGILRGPEIAVIVDGGYQKFLLTPDGRKQPALATHLQDLHAFEED